MNTKISEAAVEIVAPFFYQLLPLTEGLTARPAWVERGNSLKQDEARGIAYAALEAALPHMQQSAAPAPQQTGEVQSEGADALRNADMKRLADRVAEVGHRLSTYMPHLAEWADRAADCKKAADVLAALAARQTVGQEDVYEWIPFQALEVGKTYKTRNGSEVEIVGHSGDGFKPFKTSFGTKYRADGRYYGRDDSCQDLISVRATTVQS